MDHHLLGLASKKSLHINYMIVDFLELKPQISQGFCLCWPETGMPSPVCVCFCFICIQVWLRDDLEALWGGRLSPVVL